MLEPEMESDDDCLGPLLTPKGIRPAFVDKELAAEYLGQSTALVDRMLWATRHTDDKWLEIVANQEGDPKQRTWISTRSVERAAVRMSKGDMPPKIVKRKLLSLIWSLLTGREETPLAPVQSHAEAERAQARKFAEQQQKEQAAALEEEKQRFRQAVAKPEEGVSVEVIVDPKLFPENK